MSISNQNNQNFTGNSNPKKQQLVIHNEQSEKKQCDNDLAVLEDSKNKCQKIVDICSYLNDHYIHRYRRYENYLDSNGLPMNNTRSSQKKINNNNDNYRNYKKNQCQINMFVKSIRHDYPYQVKQYPQASSISSQSNLQLLTNPTASIIKIQSLNNDSLVGDNYNSINHLSSQSLNNLQGQNTKTNSQQYQQQSYQKTQNKPELTSQQRLLNTQQFHRCCRIVLCLIKWRRLCRYLRITRKQSVEQFQTLDLLQLAVNQALNYSTLSMKPVLYQYFQETTSFDYFSYRNEAKYFMTKLSKLKYYTVQLLESIGQYTTSSLTSNNHMIQFLNTQIGQFQFLFDGFYPRFIHERFEFSNDTLEIRNITVQQRQLLSIFFYIIYGILNRLVTPWRVLNIKEIDKVKRINAHIMLSIIFYLLHDYMKLHGPLVKTSNRYPAERTYPLRAYPRQDEEFTKEFGFTDNNSDGQEEIKDGIELLSQQAIITDNIIVGLTPRMLILDIIEKDINILKTAQDTFRSIAEVFVKQIDIAPPIL